MALEAVGSNPIIHPTFFISILGVSSSGKTTDFDSVIRRFESCYPCQNHRHNFCCVCDFLFVSRMRTVGSSTQATCRDRYVALLKSRVRQFVLGTARSGQNNADTEYLATPANKKDIASAMSFFIFHYQIINQKHLH